MITRRRFLQSSSLVALSSTVPLFLARTGRAAGADKDKQVLVVVQLDGGNDALNTVVPFADPNYEKLRPKLKIDPARLVKLNDSLGLHYSLKPLDKLLDAGDLAILPGVGYPNPNRSHFESMAVWNTARFDDEELRSYGWLGRALDPSAATAFTIGNAVPTALRGRRSKAIALNRIEEVLPTDPESARRAVGPEADDDLLAFVRRQAVEANEAADKLLSLKVDRGGGNYPGTGLGEKLKLITQLLRADLGTRVFYTRQSGYDTHSGQQFTHANLLSEFARAVAAFFDDLQSARLADRITLLAFSEFGRTIEENGSAGTDHGTAGVVFLAGPAVRGGVAGTMPSLTDLEDGEPRMTTDFRRVYATVLADWLKLADEEALAGSFERLPLFG